MKTLAIIVVIIGLASLVMGIIFVFNSFSARNDVATSIAPLPVSNLNSQYDQVNQLQQAQTQKEGAAIQNGNPSAGYVWLTLQRTSLGLARSNVGLANLTQIIGYLNIVIGIALVIVSLGMLRRSSTAPSPA